MKSPQQLYHGTCKAFVVYALQNRGKFGPEKEEVSFTPDLKHALIFAQSWGTERGLSRLVEYFGEQINSELAEPILLEFRTSGLNPLKYRLDCGKDEFYLEKGPVDIFKAKLVKLPQ